VSRVCDNEAMFAKDIDVAKGSFNLEDIWKSRSVGALLVMKNQNRNSIWAHKKLCFENENLQRDRNSKMTLHKCSPLVY
jgi:hypothetical protein